MKNQHYAYNPTSTQQLCHRQFGIGADGLLTLEKKEGYAFALLHYNADGSRGGGLCGNGSRAALHYAHHLAVATQKARFWAIDGAYTGVIQDAFVSLKLQDVADVQLLATGAYFVDNGTRHCVEMVDDVASIDMQTLGFPRRHMAPFEKMGVNLNFVQKIGDAIWIRTCECGLEVEPLSCGTGAVAAALAASVCYGLRSPIEVHTKGGVLWVTFRLVPARSFADIHLIGSVVQTFSGKIDLNTLTAHWHKNQQNIGKNLSTSF